MRTTLDLDDDVIAAARALAACQKQTMGEVVSQLARLGLHPQKPAITYRNGFPVLAARPGVTVTDEFINRLREEEGI